MGASPYKGLRPSPSHQAASFVQSEHSIMTNQDSAFWANKTVKVQTPDLHENGPMRDRDY